MFASNTGAACDPNDEAIFDDARTLLADQCVLVA
jgi:hypothetical protein